MHALNYLMRHGAKRLRRTEGGEEQIKESAGVDCDRLGLALERLASQGSKLFLARPFWMLVAGKTNYVMVSVKRSICTC